MIERYTWRGGSEMLLRHGAGCPITLLVLPALFEEANRLRRFTVSVMRHLAVDGIGTILPDLPGTGESLTDLDNVSLDDWQDAAGTMASTAFGSIALRGGALLDRATKHRWRLGPEHGDRLLRDLIRATAWSVSAPTKQLEQEARATTTRLAGNRISPALYRALSAAEPIGDAYVTAIAGPKLWRAAEPSDDPEFALEIARDIVAWTKTCATS